MSRKETINQLSLDTTEGVHSFLYRWYEIGEDRFKGDLTVSVARIDVIEAIRECEMWPGEFDAFWCFYFRGYDVNETADILDTDVETVKARLERGCTRVAEWLDERGYGIGE